MLVVKNLEKTYENGVEALKGVSFDTPDCGMIAIVGSSGCGKSTLLNVLSGMDDASSGDIFIAGEKCNPREVKNSFATIYQDYKLIENLSAIDNIMIAKELSASDYSANQIDELLDKLGILDCKNEKVLNLSGGQKQRVAIARALIQQPKIIFADEPTGNLDSKNSKNIFGLLQELAKDILIIVVTHDVETIKNYANRLIRLQDGMIIEDEIITAPTVSQVAESPQKAKVQTVKKGGLSFRTAMSVAVAFNKAKVGRRIAFMVISTLLLLVMMFCCNWAMIDYETMVSATYDKRNVGNMAISSYSKYETLKLTYGNGSFISTTHSDLTEIGQYLKDKKGINSAKVYSLVPDIFGVAHEFTGIQTHDINGEMLTLQEVAYGSAHINNYIVTNDMQSIGIKLLQGRQPQKLGEIAIPKSKLIYFNALGGYRDHNTNEYVAVDNIFEHDFYGINIVGVFDDGVSVPDKFAMQNDLFESEEEQEAYNYVSNKILAKSVIVSTAWSDVWDAALYMEGPGIADRNQGQYVHTSMIAGNTVYKNIGVAPANELTAHITGIDSVEKGTVLMNKNFASFRRVNDGDEIFLSTTLVRGTVQDLGGEYTVDREICTNKKFKVKIDPRLDNQYDIGVLYNEEDYKMMMGGYEKPQTNKIIFDMDSLSTGELKQLNAKAKQLYGGKKGTDFYQSMLQFDIDDSFYLVGEYSEMRMIGNYVFIAASIILVVVVGLLIYNSISIIIASKANDLLILKSLGANRIDYLKIYGIFTFIQLLIELVIGIGLGIGVVFLFNFLMTQVIGQTLIVMLPLMPWAVFTSILIAIFASLLALTFNICGISDKNLRKAFQKTKE